jgi:OmpA-OmpF porin, OOP family
MKMKTSKWMVLLVGSLAISQVMANDRDFDDRWAVSPSVGMAKVNTDRLAGKNEFNYAALEFGRFFSRDFSLDFRLDRYNTNFERVAVPVGESDRFSLWSGGLVGRYHLGDNQAFRPYVMLAGGIQSHRSYFDEGRDIYGSLGLGVRSRLNDRIDLRLQGEARYDNDRDTFDRNRGFKDLIVSAGLNVRLGAAPTPPAPEPAPEPVRREPAPTPPPPPPEPEPEPEVLFEFDAMVTFDFDSANLRPGAIAELNEAVGLLNLHPEITRIEVAGHTCDLGDASYNQRLSERRAQAVRDFLVDNDVDADRLVVRGYGEDSPKVPNTSDANRQQNRRVELIVLERTDD